MTEQEPSERQLREEIAEYGDPSHAVREVQLLHALIAYLDRKVERAFEAGRTVRTYETDIFGERKQIQVPTFQSWNDSQRGKDEP